MNDSIAKTAGQDLSGAQYQVVGVSGTIVATNPLAFGIVQNKPLSGEDTTILYSGRSKFKAGDTITIGDSLTVTTSGFIVAISSGDGVIGKALFAVASGGFTEGIFDFAAVVANV